MTTKYFARTIALLVSLMVLGYGTFVAAETDFQRDLKEVAKYLIRQLPSYEKADTYMREFQENRGKLIKEQGWAPLLKDDEKFHELYNDYQKEGKALTAMMAIMAERNRQAFQQYVTQEAAAIRDKKEGNQLLSALICAGAETIVEDQKHRKELAWETFHFLLWQRSQEATAASQEATAQPTPAQSQVSASAGSTATTATAAQPAASTLAPASTGGSKYAKFVKRMDPHRAQQVSDSFTRPVEEREHPGLTNTGGGIVGIPYGTKEKLPGATSTAATAVSSGGEQDATTQGLASGLTNSSGSLDASLLKKAVDAICAQQGFKNHALVTQIRTCSEEIVEELRPSEPE